MVDEVRLAVVAAPLVDRVPAVTAVAATETVLTLPDVSATELMPIAVIIGLVT